MMGTKIMSNELQPYFDLFVRLQMSAVPFCQQWNYPMQEPLSYSTSVVFFILEGDFSVNLVF
jgi:hypothetical protein